MKVHVSGIPDDGLKRLFAEKDSAWEGLAGMSMLAFPSGQLFVQKSGRDVFIKGTVSAAAECSCSRCLDHFRLPLDLSFQHTLRPLPESDSEGSERELLPEDLEYGYYEEDIIELDRLIEEQLLLAMPMKPLCREDCRGLCSGCGTNRNEEHCNCADETQSSPFDVLKNAMTKNP